MSVLKPWEETVAHAIRLLGPDSSSSRVMWVEVNWPQSQLEEYPEVSQLQVLQVMELLRVMAKKEPKWWPLAVAGIYNARNSVDITDEHVAWSIGFVLRIENLACADLLDELRSFEAFHRAKQALCGESPSLDVIEPTPICLRTSPTSTKEAQALISDLNEAERSDSTLQRSFYALESIEVTTSDPTAMSLLANTLSPTIRIRELRFQPTSDNHARIPRTTRFSAMAQLLSTSVETLRIYEEIDFKTFTALCSALRESQGLKCLHLENVLCRDAESRSIRWKWLTYALFSRDAGHQIESISLLEMELENTDVAAVREVLEAPYPKMTLDDRRKYTTQTSERQFEAYTGRIRSLSLRFGESLTGQSVGILENLVSALLKVTVVRDLSIRCDDRARIALTQDDLARMSPQNSHAYMRTTASASPRAIIRLFTDACSLRSLVLHDLSVWNPLEWQCLFDALRNPEQYALARHLERLDIKFKVCGYERMRPVFDATKEMLARNDRLKLIILRGSTSYFTNALSHMNRQRFSHPLAVSSKLAFLSLFATSPVVKRRKAEHQVSALPYLDAELVRVVFSFAYDTFQRRVYVVEGSQFTMEHHVVSRLSD